MESHAAAGQHRCRRSAQLICAFAAATVLVHLLTTSRYGYFRDELYFFEPPRTETSRTAALPQLFAR